MPVVGDNDAVLYATHAVIDLDAVAHNLRGIRRRVGARAVLVAVKADGYGHGAERVSRFIESEGLADWLGVATVPEGIALREAGVQLPILKLSHAGDTEVEAALEAGITLTVVDAASVDQVARWADPGTPVHLMIDTGMRRIGAEPEAAVPLSRRIDEVGLDLQGVMTHLPISDEPRGVEFTRDQLARFRRLVAEVEDARGPVPLVHASNSGAVLGHDLTGMTMVRPGVMVYGYYPDPHAVRSVDLRPSMELRTRVTFVKRIGEGETVGYGRTWTASRDTWIATVTLGYADGYSRLLSNRGRMSIRGRSYPVVGRVCMDQTMLDLGPDAPDVEVGDEVVAMGGGATGGAAMGVEETALAMGTIPYEVTCLITPRVTRHYAGGA